MEEEKNLNTRNSCTQENPSSQLDNLEGLMVLVRAKTEIIQQLAKRI